tara:strand:- start:104 stop:445 length:342 start_codon:yes stop_codon:yes gene_type:complete
MKFTIFFLNERFNLEFVADPSSNKHVPVGVSTSGRWKGYMLVRNIGDNEVAQVTTRVATTLCVFQNNPFRASPGSTVKLTQSLGIHKGKSVLGYIITNDFQNHTIKHKKLTNS